LISFPSTRDRRQKQLAACGMANVAIHVAVVAIADVADVAVVAAGRL